MNLKLGFTLFILLLLADLPRILSRKCHKGRHKCKVRENSPIPVNLPRLCGDNIVDVYKNICETVWVRRRRRRGKYIICFSTIFERFMPRPTRYPGEIWSVVHTNSSQNPGFSKTPFKLEEFENVGFAFLQFRCPRFPPK